MLMLNICNVNV